MKHLLISVQLFGSLLLTGCESGDEKTSTYPTQIPQSEKIPIVAWHGVRSEYASVERFQEAEQMGITLNYSRNYDVETALECLDFAAQTGVKLIVECEELYNSDKRADAVKQLMRHPALAGYFVMDEPHPSQFANMSEMMADIQHVDQEHLCYANIFPTGGPEFYEALGVKDYEEYIDRYMTEVPQITFLSFDKYPIVDLNGQRAVMEEWYQCLEIVRDRALRSGMDFWSFMLTVPHSSYPQPTINDLRLQAYSNLAYGTQALQCFTYWTPTVENPELWNYRNAPIAEDGTRTETYDLVKSVLDEIQRFSWVFLDNRVTGVYHMGEPLPLGTRTLKDFPEEISELSVIRESTACVSFFENHGYHFMMIVNTSINQECYLNIGTQSHVRRIHKDGSVRLASDDERTLSFDPGDMLLYMW